MENIKNTLISASHTALGAILDPENNYQWLVYLMLSVPHVNLQLPVVESIKAVSHKLDKDVIKKLVDEAILSQEAIDQLEEKGLEEAFFLAQRDVDKLAILTYTLYLYGR